MKRVLVLAVSVLLLLAGASGSEAMNTQPGLTPGTGSGSAPQQSVPEPTTLFAIASGLALVGGAAWFIRRK